MHPSQHDPFKHQPLRVANLGAVPVSLAPPALDPFPHALPADTRARNAAIAIVLCTAVLLVGLVSRSWFTARGGSLGLLGIEECRGAVCQTMSWFDFARAPTELKLFSTIGIVGIVVALGLLAQAAVMLFTRRSHRVMLVPLNAALGIAAFGCFSFFIHLTFGELSTRLSISFAGLFAMGGIIAASIVIGAMVRPLARASR
jgi:hypothetical protein